MSRRLVLLAAALAGCGPRYPAQAPDTGAADSVRAAVRAYDSILVYGPPDSTAAMYTTHGILFIPGMQPLQGRQAIVDFLSPLWTSSTVLTAKTTVDTVQLFDGHALTWGTYEEIAGPKGQAPSLYRGRVVMEWTREADGHWRIARVLTQPTPATSAAGH
ncbi:MAG: YybH family protein [Gemmatimonadales bacterium]